MKDEQTYTTEEIREMLRAAIAEAGNQRAAAVKLGVSVAYLNDVIKGRAAPGRLILEALGLERIETIVYRRKQG